MCCWSASTDRSFPLRLPVVFQDILMPLWKQLLQRQDAFGQTSEWLFLDSSCDHGFTQRLLVLRGNNRRKSSSAPWPASAGNLNCWWPRCSQQRTGVRVLPSGSHSMS
jgi:hypothetical protein